MPRFFFHMHNDDVLRDDEGLDLPDEAAARREAIAGLRSIAADQVKAGALDLRHRVEVEDEAGHPLFAVTAEDAIHVDR